MNDTTTTVRDMILSTARNLGLSLTWDFIPFSQAKKPKGEDRLTLNWRIKLTRGNRVVIDTTYTAGVAHCPGYGSRDKYSEKPIVAAECETGRVCRYSVTMDQAYTTAQSINPDEADVIACLVLDCNALDYRDFEEWAESTGYDPDSRAAEAIYQTCVRHALALRAAVGEDGMTKLRDVCRDW